VSNYYEENDEHSFFTRYWGYERLEKLDEMQNNLLEFIKPSVPSEWSFDHARAIPNDSHISLVFVFERDFYPATGPGLDIKEKLRTYRKALEDLVPSGPLDRIYGRMNISKREITERVEPRYTCLMCEPRYNEIHDEQGKWGYQVNVLLIHLELFNNSAPKSS